MTTERCFACNKPLGKSPQLVQVVGEKTKMYVGSECARLIAAARPSGYQPPIGGPRLRALPAFRRSIDPDKVGRTARGRVVKVTRDELLFELTDGCYADVAEALEKPRPGVMYDITVCNLPVIGKQWVLTSRSFQ